jgi:hypothetical protein
MQKTINDLTQKLCYVCGSLEHQGLFTMTIINPEISNWWAEHEKRDNHRIDNEMSVHFLAHPTDDPIKVAQGFIERAQAVHPISEHHKHWFLAKAKKFVAPAAAPAGEKEK